MSSSQLEREIHERVKSLLPNATDIKLIQYLDGGWSNRNYHIQIDGQAAVLRVKNPLSVAPGRERRYLECRLAPEVLAYDQDNGNMITVFVEGHLLVESPIEPVVAAAYMRELHDEIPVGVRSYRAEPVIDQYLIGLSLTASIQSIYANLNWEPTQIGGCHNELNDWNVIKTPTGFCTLDWESAGDNDPIFDVVGLCYGLEFNDEGFDTCIGAYDPKADPEHVRRTRILYQIREHAWALDRLRHGSDHEGIRKQKEDTKAEIQRLHELVVQSD